MRSQRATEHSRQTENKLILVRFSFEKRKEYLFISAESEGGWGSRGSEPSGSSTPKDCPVELHDAMPSALVQVLDRDPGPYYHQVILTALLQQKWSS